MALACAMASSMAIGPLSRPAMASEGSTWTTIAAAAALIGGIVLYNNYEHKKQAANRVVGYTRNGGTVYGDGRIVMPNGSVVYPNSRGQYPWGQSAYYMPYATGYAYDPDHTGRYDRTHRHNYDRDDYDRDDYRPTYRTYDRDRNRAVYRDDDDRYVRGRAPAKGHRKHHGKRDRDDH
jgi:hypothetical protein